MSLIEIGSIHRKRIFSLEEANLCLAVILIFTESSQREVNRLKNKMLQTLGHERDALQLQIDELIEKWYAKVQKLGAKPKGVWLADFDNGTGYYCWKYPETTIQFQHGYKEGYLGRHALTPSPTCTIN